MAKDLFRKASRRWEIALQHVYQRHVISSHQQHTAKQIHFEVLHCTYDCVHLELIQAVVPIGNCEGATTKRHWVLQICVVKRLF